MNNQLARILVPLGLFLGTVGYLSWPYLTMEAEAAREKPKPPTIDAQTLHPEFEEPALRNPFAAAQPQRAAKATSVVEAPSPSAPAVDREPVGSWKLGATLVGGPRKAAVLDGRVYREGEFLLDRGGTPGPWKLAVVQAERVLLTNRAGSRTLAVKFPERSYPDPKAKGEAKPAKPGQVAEQEVETLLKQFAGTRGNLPAGLDPNQAILTRILGLGGN